MKGAECCPGHEQVKSSLKVDAGSINKTTLTNVLSCLIVILGYVSPVSPDLFKSIGFFALSGAITNWLAIYMLFEKVPGLYGSGVIPSRFEEFKTGIRKLIMEQFFTAANIQKFFNTKNPLSSKATGISLTPLLEQLDYDLLFSKLLVAVKTSPFGAMLAFMGGEAALEPIKEPFKQKMQEALREFSQTPSFQLAVSQTIAASFDSQAMVQRVEAIVQARLEELTPNMVKDMIQEMIRTHLGWLVVWGGVFGGLLGLLAYFL